MPDAPINGEQNRTTPIADLKPDHFAAQQLIEAARQKANTSFKWLLLILPVLFWGALRLYTEIDVLRVLEQKEIRLQEFEHLQHQKGLSEESKKHAAQRVSQLRSQISNLEDKETVNLPLGDKTVYPIPLVFVPTLLSVLLVGALFFLHKQRISITRQFLLGLNIAYSRPDTSQHHLGEIVEMIPPWCFPIPRPVMQELEDFWLRAALSRKRFAGYIQAITAVGGIALITYQCAIGYFAVVISHETGHAGVRALNVLPWIGLLFEMIVFVDWIVPNSKDVTSKLLPSVLNVGPLDRRQLITGAIAVITTSAFWTASWSLLAFSQTGARSRSPRFRRQSLPPKGFYQDTVDNVVHHARKKKQHACLRQMPRNRLRAISDTQAESTPFEKVHLVCGSCLIEKQAFNLIAQSRYREACVFLVKAANAKAVNSRLKPNLRWCDLAAGLSVRFSLDVERKVLLAIAERIVQLPPGKRSIPSPGLQTNKTSYRKINQRQAATGRPKLTRNQRLINAAAQRLKIWTDPESNWHKKWSDKTKKVKWAGLLM